MRLKHIFSYLALFIFFVACQPKEKQVESNPDRSSSERPAYAMVIHGGAGTILRENMDRETEKAYLDILEKVLTDGKAMLQAGQLAEEIVVKSIITMEDSPLFNAGKGAVFTNAGRNEMDASIMRGVDQHAGAVSGVTTIKNPITAAFAVLNNSEHVLLSGAGAEEFAKGQGCELVDPSYFSTENRLKALERAKAREDTGMQSAGNPDNKYGTVGCVVLDKSGNIVAGTSTGGMTNKRYNRVGDSPIIGAGTYADNATCGISSTGHGEYFIRYAVAHDIAARMEYKGVSIHEAADEVIMKKLVEKGGSGGIIGLSKDGEITMTFNTPGMYRGYVLPDELVVKIYED